MAKATDPINEHYAYHDDPIQVQPSQGKKAPSAFFALLLLAVAATYFIQTTLASNISINSGARIEFGQGSLSTVACSGATALTITPIATFTNTGGGGDFNFSSLSVSNIPSDCYGKKFTIRAYGNTDTPLAIFNSTSTTALIIDNAGTFELGTGASGMSIISGSGTFTLTFTSPVALSSTLQKIGIESSAATCAEGATCVVGDTGPGGGTIFYVDAAGFNCGTGFTSTGSPKGGLCYNLEAAPSRWANSAITNDPQKYWAVTADWRSDVTGITDELSVNNTTGIGLGYKNSLAIVAQQGVYNASSNNYAAGAARAYAGGTMSDWYLPTTVELNQMCKWAKGVAFTSIATVCTGGTINTGVGAAGFVANYYWSSSEYMTNYAWYHFFYNGSQGSSGKTMTFYVRPVRAF